MLWVDYENDFIMCFTGNLHGGDVLKPCDSPVVLVSLPKLLMLILIQPSFFYFSLIIKSREGRK